MADTLRELDRVLAARRAAGAVDTSYTARLLEEGLDSILRKIGEESTEVILAAKAAERADGQTGAFVSEIADLWFHCLVALTALNSDSSAVLEELRRRFNISGLAEKAARSSSTEQQE